MSESAKRATPGFEREVVEDGHHACSSISGTFSWGKQVDWIGKDEKPHANKRTLLRQGRCHGTTPPGPLLIRHYKSTKKQPTSKRDARVPASRSPATAF
jgi:hypothetical protein